MRVFAAIEPTPAEREAPMPGDDIVPQADVAMDRPFDVPAPPETAWPWLSWAITLRPAGDDATRVQLRLRLGNLRRRWLAASAGELIDQLTIAGLAAGLLERVRG